MTETVASNVSSSPIVTGFEGLFTEIDIDGPVGRPTDSAEERTSIGTTCRRNAIRNIIL